MNKKMNNWERLEKNIGEGVCIVRYKKRTPFQKIMGMGKIRKAREYLESQKVGIPNYTEEEKEKIMREMKRYFNYQENKDEK